MFQNIDENLLLRDPTKMGHMMSILNGLAKWGFRLFVFKIEDTLLVRFG